MAYTTAALRFAAVELRSASLRVYDVQKSRQQAGMGGAAQAEHKHEKEKSMAVSGGAAAQEVEVEVVVEKKKKQTKKHKRGGESRAARRARAAAEYDEEASHAALLKACNESTETPLMLETMHEQPKQQHSQAPGERYAYWAARREADKARDQALIASMQNLLNECRITRVEMEARCRQVRQKRREQGLPVKEVAYRSVREARRRRPVYADEEARFEARQVALLEACFDTEESFLMEEATFQLVEAAPAAARVSVRESRRRRRPAYNLARQEALLEQACLEAQGSGLLDDDAELMVLYTLAADEYKL